MVLNLLYIHFAFFGDFVILVRYRYKSFFFHEVLTVFQTLVLGGQFTVARGQEHSILDTVLQQLPVALVNGGLLLLKHLTVTPEGLEHGAASVTTACVQLSVNDCK